MKNYLITFSGQRYHDSTRKIVEDGPRLGADRVFVYDDHWLHTCRPDFVREHQALFKPCVKSGYPRGEGHFVWKMLILLDALRRAPENSTVCYTDADCWPVADMTPLFDMAERDSIVLFAACSHSQRHWSKRDTQIVMQMDSEFWRNKQAGVARFMLFKKRGSVRFEVPESGMIRACRIDSETFLEEWLRYTADVRANTFAPSVLAEEYFDLKEARCEQAILTNLAHKYNISLHREADQWGNDFRADFPSDTYPQIFESTGVYSYAPEPRGPGSAFRNMND